MADTAKVMLLFAGFCFASNILRADALQANGICELNSCTSKETLAFGADVADSFSFVYTFANSDRYRATGTIAAYSRSDTTGFVIGLSAANVTATYLGNTLGTASSTDTLAIDFLQYFRTSATRSGVNNSGFEYVNGVFDGPLADASSVRAQSFSNGGAAMALLGPFLPPDPFEDSRLNQPFSFGPVTLFDFRDTLIFGEGSAVGSQIAVSNVPASPTPEPSSLLLAMAGIAILWRRAWSVKFGRQPK